MTVQITVRLPDDVAEFVDSKVRDGAGSRASAIAEALRNQQRREQAERDAEIYAATGDYPEFEAMHRHVAALGTDID